MLTSLSSTLETFKAVNFQPGVNLAIAVRSQEAAKKDSRNAVGKSSVVALIDFLLGSDCKPDHLARRLELADYQFSLGIQWDAQSHVIDRSGAEPSKIFIDSALMRPDEFRSILGKNLFGLTGAPGEPSYRAVAAFYLRQRDSGGFLNPVRTNSRQSDVSSLLALSYLFNLDQGIARRALEIAESRKSLKDLRKAAKDPVFGVAVGGGPEVEAEIATLQVSRDHLKRELDGFTVVEHYIEYQVEANRLSREIRQLNDEAVILEQRRNDLLEALESENFSHPDYSYLEDLYAEVGIALSEAVRRPFEQVREFHASVVRNRQSYLSQELSEINQRAELVVRALQELDGQRSAVMHVLEAGGALETFSYLQATLSDTESQLSQLQGKRDAIQSLADASGHLRDKARDLESATKLDLSDRSSHIQEIKDLFTSIAFEIYGKSRPAALAIQPSESGYKFIPTLGGEKSGGVSSMAMFCFDLTMAITAKRAGRGPDFIVHDSHLFDSVEERQIGAAFRVASSLCAQEGMQYIATINSDAFENALRYEPQLQYFESVRMTDEYQSGGLFGMRFN